MAKKKKKKPTEQSRLVDLGKLELQPRASWCDRYTGSCDLEELDLTAPDCAEGIKYDQGKLDWSLIPYGLVEIVTRALEYRDDDDELLSAIWSFASGEGTIYPMISAITRITGSEYPEILTPMVRVLQWAAENEKYPRNNWLLGMRWSRLASAGIRHMLACRENPDALDPESGLPHIEHAICCALMLVHYAETETGEDDRFCSLDE